MSEYAIEMLGITKKFPGIIANDNITLQLKKGEIHALLGENGAGKSTLMSVLFGLYQPEEGEIHKDGKKVEIQNPNDANDLGIGMVHQHFKLVECFSVLDNIILGVETTKSGLLQKDGARKKVMELSEKYGLAVDPDAIIEDVTVGMQQRTEILKMLYRDNEILIFDEPTAVLTPQEIQELMQIMKNLAAEGKSILFITHKLAEIMQVADRCSVLRKGKYIGTVDIKDTTPEKLSAMMVGIWRNNAIQTIIASLLCIVIGLFVGYIVLLIINPEGASDAIIAILKNYFYYPSEIAVLKYCGTTMVKTSALLMCSLSVLFAYKVGLFNIGAAGQYVVGAGASLYFALKLGMPWYVCLLAAIVISALVGGLSGALKAYFNVNEVISCIMLNWISLYIVLHYRS